MYSGNVLISVQQDAVNGLCWEECSYHGCSTLLLAVFTVSTCWVSAV